MEDDDKPPTLNQSQDEIHLEQILKSMLAADSQKRLTAEDEFKKISPDEKATLLLRVSKHSEAAEELRSLSLDLLSRLLNDILHTWCSDNLVPFGEQLIQSILTETSDKIRAKLGDILVQVAAHSLVLNSGVFAYPWIADFIRDCVNDKSSSLKRIALSLIRRVPNVFGSKGQADLRDCIQKGLKDADSSVRFCALEAFSDVVKNDTLLSSLLPTLIQICEEMAVDDKDNTRWMVLATSTMKQLAIDHTNTFRSHLKAIIRLCSVIRPESDELTRGNLTGIQSSIFLHRDNADLDDYECSKIRHYVFRCAPPMLNRRSALDIITAIPRAFGNDYATAIHDLIEKRLNDEDSLVRTYALDTLSDLIAFHDEKYLAIVAVPLLPKVIEMAHAIFNEKIEQPPVGQFKYNGIDCLWDISQSKVILLEPHRFAILALSTRVIRMTNTDEGKTLTEKELQNRNRAVDIIGRLISTYSINEDDNIDFDYDDEETEMPFRRMNESDRETIVEMCHELVKTTNSDQEGELFKKIFTIISFLAFAIDDDMNNEQTWSEIHKQIKDIPQNTNKLKDTLAIAGRVTAIGTASEVLSFYEKCLVHSEESIRCAALLSFEAHCRRVRNAETLKVLGSIIPLILTMAHEDIRENKNPPALLCLYSLSNQSRLVIHDHLSDVASLFCELSKNIHSKWHSAATIVLVNNFLGRKEIGDEHTRDILSSCLLVLSELSDDLSSWAAVDDPHNLTRPNSQVFRMIYEKLETLSQSQRDSDILFQLSITLLDHADWKRRHAGLVYILIIVGKGKIDAKTLFTRIIPLLEDSNCRVRAIVCSVLNNIFYRDKQYHAIIIPALHNVFEGDRLPRVAAAAAVALEHCCSIGDYDYYPFLSVHHDSLMGTAGGVLKKTHTVLLSGRKTLILAQTIAVVLSIKRVAGPLYIRYYNKLIKPLKAILASPIRCRTLDAITLECASHIGIAVGKDKFAADSTEIMRSLMPRFESLLLSLEKDFVANFIRMATAMGDSFLEFIPILMPLIRQSIEATNLGFDDNGNVIQINADGGIRSRKATSCTLSTQLARLFGAAFRPYAVDLAQLALAHLTMPIYKENREWPVEIFPALLACTKGEVALTRKLCMEYWRVVGEIIRSEKEDRNENMKLIRSINECVKNVVELSENDRWEIREVVKKEKMAREERRLGREKMKAEAKWFEMVAIRSEEKRDKLLTAPIDELEITLNKYY